MLLRRAPGNALSGFSVTAEWHTIAPTAVRFLPRRAQQHLAAGLEPRHTFSEAVKAGAGTITLETAAGEVVQPFAAASDPGIQSVGSSVVINPAPDLTPGTTHNLGCGENG